MNPLKDLALGVLFFGGWIVFLAFIFPTLQEQYGQNVDFITVGLLLITFIGITVFYKATKKAKKKRSKDNTLSTYTAIAIAFLIFGPLAVIIGVGDSQKALKSLQWSGTTGEILAVTIEKKVEPRLNARDRVYFEEEYSYWLDIRYKYSVSEKVFESSRVQFGSRLGGTLTEAQAFQEQFFQGRHVPVYYDQTNPGESVLIHGIGKGIYLILSIGTLFTLFGLLMAGLAIKKLLERFGIISNTGTDPNSHTLEKQIPLDKHPVADIPMSPIVGSIGDINLDSTGHSEPEKLNDLDVTPIYTLSRGINGSVVVKYAIFNRRKVRAGSILLAIGLGTGLPGIAILMDELNVIGFAFFFVGLLFAPGGFYVLFHRMTVKIDNIRLRTTLKFLGIPIRVREAAKDEIEFLGLYNGEWIAAWKIEGKPITISHQFSGQKAATQALKAIAELTSYPIESKKKRQKRRKRVNS